MSKKSVVVLAGLFLPGCGKVPMPLQIQLGLRWVLYQGEKSDGEGLFLAPVEAPKQR
jgi:hypothetical protein